MESAEFMSAGKTSSIFFIFRLSASLSVNICPFSSKIGKEIMLLKSSSANFSLTVCGKGIRKTQSDNVNGIGESTFIVAKNCEK